MHFERQRHVEVVDLLVGDNGGGFTEGAEQRQAAVAQVIATGLVIDEPDQLVAKLAVFEYAPARVKRSVTGNGRAIAVLRRWVERDWFKWLRTRSRAAPRNWEWMQRILEVFPLPPSRVVHSVFPRAANP